MKTHTRLLGPTVIVFSTNMYPLSTTLVAANFIVDTSINEVDVSPGDGVCASFSGECTLRAAVMEANALTGPDTVRVTTDVELTILPDPLFGEEFDDRVGDLDIADDLIIAGDDK